MWGEGCSVSSAPQPGPRGLGVGLQEISAVMYSKPPGWKCSKSEIVVVVLYLVPVSSGDLKAWGKSRVNHLPATPGVGKAWEEALLRA